jgi:beta-fructofuranosidase
MFKHPGNRIGDMWFFVEEDIVHCYYLTCDEYIEAHKIWDIGHATSRDLMNWEIHDLALKMAPKGEWDEVLATGSILKRNNVYWMAYTGHTTQEVGLASSTDLFNWTRVDYNPLPGLNEQFYTKLGTGKRKKKHWRDPFLFEYDNWIYYAVCANDKNAPDDGRGNIGLARSEDMIKWVIVPPPKVPPMFQEMECPQILFEEDNTYLIFSTGPSWLSDKYKELYKDELTGFAPYSLVANNTHVADDKFAPFELHGNGRILPIDFPYIIYALQIVRFKGKAYLLGTSIQEPTTGVSDPITVQFTPHGIKMI